MGEKDKKELEIERRFTNAGWSIDDGFSGHLVIGYSADALSILAHRAVFENASGGDALFEILDHMRNVSYWVRDVPSPQQAQELLQRHGKPPQEWDD